MEESRMLGKGETRFRKYEENEWSRVSNVKPPFHISASSVTPTEESVLQGLITKPNPNAARKRQCMTKKVAIIISQTKDIKSRRLLEKYAAISLKSRKLSVDYAATTLMSSRFLMEYAATDFKSCTLSESIEPHISSHADSMRFMEQCLPSLVDSLRSMEAQISSHSGSMRSVVPQLSSPLSNLRNMEPYFTSHAYSLRWVERRTQVPLTNWGIGFQRSQVRQPPWSVSTHGSKLP